MKKLIAFAILLSSLTTLSAQGITFEKEETTWADILKKAKTENKIVFVDAYTSWCGPCKTMAKNIFPQKEVGDVFNAKFVNAKIDMEHGEGPELAKKYAVQAYPTYIFVNGDGELVHRSLGAMPIEKFISVGEAASDPERQFFSLKKKFDKGERSPDFLRKFAYSCQEAQEQTLIQPVADAYLATQTDLLTKENMDFLLKFVTSVESPNFAFLVKNQAAFAKEKGEKAVAEQIEQIALQGLANPNFDRAKREFDFAKIKEMGAKHLTPEMTEKIVSILTLAQAQMKGDLPLMLNQLIVHYDKYPSGNPQELNQFARFIFEQSSDKTQLTKGLEWSLKSIGLADQFAHNETAAALYFKLSNKQKAKEYAEKAINQAKTSGDNPANIDDLLKKIEAM